MGKLTLPAATLAAALIAGPVQADGDTLLDHDLRRLHSLDLAPNPSHPYRY